MLISADRQTESKTARSRWQRLLLGGLVAAVTVGGALGAAPAMAYDHDWRGHHDRFYHGPHWGWGPGIYVGPPPPVVYAPPPVAYAPPPPVYYAPQPSLNVVVPLRIR